MKIPHIILSGLFALIFGLYTQSAQAGAISFTFTGLCDDCAGVDTLFPGNPANMDDGIFEAVSGTLTLFDYFPPGEGEDSFFHPAAFSYSGSSLLEPFSFGPEDGGAAFGVVAPDGTLFGPLDVISFSYSFTIYPDGFFIVGASEFGEGPCGDCEGPGGPPDVIPFDIGFSGSLTPVPAPGALALLGIGLIGVYSRRRLMA